MNSNGDYNSLIVFGWVKIKIFSVFLQMASYVLWDSVPKVQYI